jgi:hypothetical protein
VPEFFMNWRSTAGKSALIQMLMNFGAIRN